MRPSAREGCDPDALEQCELLTQWRRGDDQFCLLRLAQRLGTRQLRDQRIHRARRGS